MAYVRGHRLRELLVSAICLFAGVATADVPTAQQDCVQRNLAVCEFPSGLHSTQPGPCPAASKTIKPQGREDCSAAGMSAPAAHVVPAQPAVARGRSGDLAWVGGVERWLIPALIYGGAGCALLWAVWRWRWRGRRRAQASAPRIGTPVWLVSGGIGVLAGWKSAGMAFRHVFDSYDNHDSAAPLLLAAPIWLGTFVLVAGGVCALLVLAYRAHRAAP